MEDESVFGCAPPPNKRQRTSFLDTAASVTCIMEGAPSKDAKIQRKNKLLDTPSNIPIRTTRTRELLMNKLPPPAKVAFTVPGIPHNILSGPELVDAGCALYLDKYMAEIDYEGETIYRGWRDKPSRLWKFDIDPNDGKSILPLPDNDILDTEEGIILSTMQYDVKADMVLSEVHEGVNMTINAMYECENKKRVYSIFACSVVFTSKDYINHSS